MGLTSEQARTRLKRFGPNILVRTSWTASLWDTVRRMADPMALMLVAAAAVNFWWGELRDAIILSIAAFPVLAVDVALEARSRQALKQLARAVAPTAHVVRDEREIEIPTRELVPGDIIVMKEGDVVHADGVVRMTNHLAMDESQLTGESIPQEKLAWEGKLEAQPANAAQSGAYSFSDELNNQYRFFAGSQIVTGSGYGEITGTGGRTQYGEIARLAGSATHESTPLERKTARLAGRFLLIALTVAISIFVLNLLSGAPLPRAILYSISIAISAVPEEFLLVLAAFLSLGAWRLSHNGVLVRRLASVETLGSATVICLDKTGTLTRGSYALEMHIPLDGDVSDTELLEAAALACEPLAVDPLEQAILARCRERGIDVDRLHSRWDLIHDYPFDIQGKHMSHVWAERNGPAPQGPSRIVAKGALEGVLEHCAISDEQRRRVEEANANLADQGVRVLAVAGRWASTTGETGAEAGTGNFPGFTGTREEDERGFRLYGLLGFRDPLRPEAIPAVAECQSAGIKLKLITGDHALTAHAIAEAAGILHEDSMILTGSDLDRIPSEALPEAVEASSIFARVRPEQKYAIVDALIRAGEIVAMTGDGINDAPALKRASVGVSMGQRGTEVARAASDLVLLEDDFGALVAAVRAGRQVFSRIQRAFLYLAGFKSMVVSLALAAPILGLPPILLILQLVWLELIVHPVSVLVFKDIGEPDGRRPLRRSSSPAAAPSQPLLPMVPALRSIASGLLLTAGALSLYVLHLGSGEDYARSIAMAVVILGSLAMVWAELAGERPWWQPPRLNAQALVICAAVAASLPLCIHITSVARALQMAPISAHDWGVVSLVIFAAVGWRPFGFSPQDRQDKSRATVERNL